MVGTGLKPNPICPSVGFGRLQACLHTGHQVWVQMYEKDTLKPLPTGAAWRTPQDRPKLLLFKLSSQTWGQLGGTLKMSRDMLNLNFWLLR